MEEKWHYYKEDDELYRFKIEDDDDPLNPRFDYDNMGTMNIWWNRYSFGDNKGKGNPDEMLNDLIRENVPKEKYDEDKLEYEWMKNYKMVLLQEHIVLLPCFIYEHSGVTISCSNASYPYNDRWDAGMAGFIYATKGDYCKWMCLKDVDDETYRKHAREILVAEVREYDMYLQNECYGFVRDKYDESIDEWYEEDSCWGFLTDKWGDDLVELFRSELTKEPLIDEDEAFEIAEAMHEEYLTMAQADTMVCV